MALRFKLQLVVVADDQEMSVDEIVVLNKEHERLDQLGPDPDRGQGALVGTATPNIDSLDRCVLGITCCLPDVRPTTRHQGPRDHRVPNAVWQPRASQPAAAPLFVPAH